MPLSVKKKQALKAAAHPLKPVVLIGNKGLTDMVKNEIEQAIEHHELIKIRIAENDREIRRTLFQNICEQVQAELVQVIGNIGVIYRKRQEK